MQPFIKHTMIYLDKCYQRFLWIVLSAVCINLSFTGFMQAEVLQPATLSIYDQIAKQRANSVDCGDYYLTLQGEQKLHRLAGAIAVSFEEAADKESILNDLTAFDGLLSEYAFEVIDFGRIAMFKAELAGESEKLMHATVVTDLVETVRRVPGLRSTSPVFIDPDSGLWMIPTGEIIIQLKEDVQPERIFGNREIRRPPATEKQFILTLRGATSTDVFGEVNQLMENPDVEWSAPNFLMQGLINSLNDTYYNQQWHLNNTGQTGGKTDADIDAPEAWTITTGRSDIAIAVLDSGVETNHPDLRENLFTNSSDSDADGIDNDNNGYVDDAHGWDFYPGTTTPNGNNNSNPKTDFDNHGTSVAGVAVARGNNGIGVASVAYTSRFLPIRIGEQIDEQTISIYADRAAAAILYAAGINNIGQRKWDGADILSISLSLGNEPQIQNALTLAATKGRNGKGCPVFCSTGNGASGYRSWKVPDIGGYSGFWSWVVAYEKDDSIDSGQDTVWMTEFENAEGSVYRFDSMDPPPGWYLDPFVGKLGWYIEDDPNHAYGTSRYQVRPEKIGHGQKAYIMAPAFYVGDDRIPGIRFKLWRSCEGNDKVKLYLFNYDNSTLSVPLGTLNGAEESVSPFADYPASHPDTIAVGASTDFDYRADYSQYGPALDFVAPSSGGNQQITTTDRTGDAGYSPAYENDPFNPNYTPSFGGTSASTPLAAGVAALILSKNPELTASEVRQIMRGSCDQIGDVMYEDGWNKYYGYGRINVRAALDQATPEDGLIGWWKFDEGSGTNALDSSGHGNHGTLRGDPQWVDGQEGYGLDLDGAGDYVEILPIGIHSNTVTMTAWVKRNGNQTGWTGIIFHRTNTLACGIGFSGILGSSNHLQYHWNNNSSSTYGFASGLAVPDNEWAFVALVIEPSKATIYLNGTTNSAVNPVAHMKQEFDGPLLIGLDSVHIDRAFRGRIDDARVYNKSLTEAEIHDLYESLQ